MKLRNKKTGKIIKLDIHYIAGKNYESLAEINKDWEDYEEPKEYWYINASGEVNSFCEEYEDKEDTEASKQIGNYFEAREEAELAVEKLKAWKRLKDKGFRFDSYDVADREGDDPICGQVYFKGCNYDKEEIENDLYLLFGGEE